FATPGISSIGFRARPTPPSRLAPWQAVQPAELKVAWPFVGSPGSAEPEEDADGEGDASARVEIPVRSRMPGIASATRPYCRRIRLSRISAHSIQGTAAGRAAGIPRRVVGLALLMG